MSVYFSLAGSYRICVYVVEKDHDITRVEIDFFFFMSAAYSRCSYRILYVNYENAILNNTRLGSLSYFLL